MLSRWLAASATRNVPLALSPDFMWDAASYSDAPGPHVRNIVATESVDGNLLRGGNRLMNKFSTLSGVLVIGNQTDHLGNANSANTYTASNVSDGMDATNTATVTVSNAGTYTYSLWLKSNTGASQSIKYGFYAGTANKSLQTATVTTSWQKFTHTETFTAGQTTKIAVAITGNGVDIPNVVIDDVRVDIGATAGTAQPLAGHLYLGPNGLNSSLRPTVSGGAIQYGDGKPSYAQFASSKSLQNPFTVVAWVKQTATGPALASILSKFGADYGYFFFGLDSGAPRTIYAGYSAKVLSSLISLSGDGYHLLWMNYDGTYINLGLDDIVIARNQQSLSSQTLLNVEFGSTNELTFYYYPGDVSFIAKYNKILTQSELKSIREYGRGVASVNGQTTGKLQTVLVVEGDSISDSTLYSYTYATKHVNTLSQKVFCVNPALSGSGISHAVTRGAWVDSVCATAGADYVSPRKRILSVFLGANGATVPATAQAWCDELETYINARKAAQNAGDKIIVCTLLPNQNPGFNARRNDINTILRTWVGSGKCDAIADFGADATVGVDAASANATYYPDGLHPSDATHTILAPIHKAAVESML